MKNFKSKNLSGFTLIELLIVIAIIGILAVAFLPTLLGAPAKGRDTRVIADLQKVQKVLVNTNLQASKYPTEAGTIIDARKAEISAVNSTWLTDFGAQFGGALPKHPVTGKFYYYKKAPAASYAFGLWGEIEEPTNANGNCTTGVATLGAVDTDAATFNCYIILTQ